MDEESGESTEEDEVADVLTCVGRTEQTSYTKHETRIESHAELIGHRIIFTHMRTGTFA